MSTHSVEETTAPSTQPSVEAKGSALHGVLIGLIPLGLLAGVVLLAVIATAIARGLTVSGGFYVDWFWPSSPLPLPAGGCCERWLPGRKPA